MSAFSREFYISRHLRCMKLSKIFWKYHLMWMIQVAKCIWWPFKTWNGKENSYGDPIEVVVHSTCGVQWEDPIDAALNGISRVCLGVISVFCFFFCCFVPRDWNQLKVNWWFGAPGGLGEPRGTPKFQMPGIQSTNFPLADENDATPPTVTPPTSSLTGRWRVGSIESAPSRIGLPKAQLEGLLIDSKIIDWKAGWTHKNRVFLPWENRESLTGVGCPWWWFGIQHYFLGLFQVMSWQTLEGLSNGTASGKSSLWF